MLFRTAGTPRWAGHEVVGEQCGHVVEEGLVLHVLEHHALNADCQMECDELTAARWTQADLQGMQHELNAERWTQDP